MQKGWHVQCRLLKQKAMNELEPGQVLEIHATDKGAKNDLTAWAKSGGHELLQTEEGDVLKF